MLSLHYGWLSVRDGTGVLYIKEMILIISFCFIASVYLFRGFLKSKIVLSRIDKLIFVYFLYVMISFFAGGSESLLVRLAGFRSLTLLPVLYLLGKWLMFPQTRLPSLYSLVTAIGVFIAVFGLLEAYIFPDDFWLAIGHEEYYLMKRGRPIQDELYGNMRFWLPGTEEPLRRVASITGDPLISSYPMAYMLVLAFSSFLYKRKMSIKYGVLSSIVLLAIALTLSRGAHVSIVIAVGLLVASRGSLRNFRMLTLAGFFGIIILVSALGDTILDYTYGKGHIYQLVSGINRGLERPIGFGLGTASSVVSGVVKAGGDGEETFAGGGDSYVGSALTQIGICGASLLFTILFMMCADIYSRGAILAKEDDRYAWVYLGTAGMLAGLFITCTVNESGYGFVGSGITFLVAGILSSHRHGCAVVGAFPFESLKT